MTDSAMHDWQDHTLHVIPLPMPNPGEGASPEHRKLLHMSAVQLKLHLPPS